MSLQKKEEIINQIIETSVKHLNDRITELERMVGTLADYKKFEYKEDERYYRFKRSVERLGDCIKEFKTIKKQHKREFPQVFQNALSAMERLYKFCREEIEKPDYYRNLKGIFDDEDDDGAKLFSFDLSFGELQPFYYEMQIEMFKIASDIILLRQPQIPVFMFVPDEILQYSEAKNNIDEKIDYLREVLDEYNYYEYQLNIFLSQYLFSVSQSRIAKIFELARKSEIKEFIQSNKSMFRDLEKPNHPTLRDILTYRIEVLERDRYVDDFYSSKPRSDTNYDRAKRNEIGTNLPEKDNHKHLTKDSSENKYYKVNEVCELFGVSRSTVYNWMNSGKLPFRAMRGKRYISEEDIEKAVQRIDFTNWQEIPEIVQKIRNRNSEY